MKAELYINNQRVDIDDNFKVPFNKRLNDLQKLSDIKTDYSKSVTIPRTINNDKIFSHLYKLDKLIIESQSSTTINPKDRPEYILYNNSDIVSRGIVKLSSISNKGYEIVLFSDILNFFSRLKDIKFGNFYYKKGDVDKILLTTKEIDALDESEICEFDFMKHVGRLDEKKMMEWFSENSDEELGNYLHPLFTWNGDEKSYTKNKEITLTLENKLDRYEYSKDRLQWHNNFLDFSLSMKGLLFIIKNFIFRGDRVNFDEVFFNENNPYYINTRISAERENLTADDEAFIVGQSCTAIAKYSPGINKDYFEKPFERELFDKTQLINLVNVTEGKGIKLDDVIFTTVDYKKDGKTTEQIGIFPFFEVGPGGVNNLLIDFACRPNNCDGLSSRENLTGFQIISETKPAYPIIAGTKVKIELNYYSYEQQGQIITTPACPKIGIYNYTELGKIGTGTLPTPLYKLPLRGLYQGGEYDINTKHIYEAIYYPTYEKQSDGSERELSSFMLINNDLENYTNSIKCSIDSLPEGRYFMALLGFNTQDCLISDIFTIYTEDESNKTTMPLYKGGIATADKIDGIESPYKDRPKKLQFTNQEINDKEDLFINTYVKQTPYYLNYFTKKVNLTLFDIVTEFSKIFNLYWINDGDKVTLSTLNGFFKDSNVIDWTNKLDINKFTFKYNNNIRELVFNTGKNETTYGDDYFKRYNLIYGNKKLIVNDKANEVVKIVDSKLSFPIITDTSKEITYTLTENVDLNLINNMEFSSDKIATKKSANQLFMEIPVESSKQEDVYITSLNLNCDKNKQYAWVPIPKVDNMNFEDIYKTKLPKSNTNFYEGFSTLFSRPSLNYNNIPQKTTDYNGNEILLENSCLDVYQRCWENLVNDIYSDTSKTLTVDVNLTISEFQALKWGTLIYIGDTQWRMNAIKDFDIINGGNCKVELVNITDIYNLRNCFNNTKGFQHLILNYQLEGDNSKYLFRCNDENDLKNELNSLKNDMVYAEISTTNGRNMSSNFLNNLFNGFSKIKNIKLDGSLTNIPANWVYMADMCNGCTSLISCDMSGLSLSEVSEMSNAFKDCNNLVNLSLPDIKLEKKEVVNNVNRYVGCKCDHAFDSCSSLVSFPGDKFSGMVESADYMFINCSSIESFQLKGLDFTIMESAIGMFDKCDTGTNINRAGYIWNANILNNIENSSISFGATKRYDGFGIQAILTDGVYGFQKYASWTGVKQFFDQFKGGYEEITIHSSGRNLNNNDYSNLFDGCYNLTTVNLEFLHNETVTTTENMFSGCTRLKCVNFGDSNFTALTNAKNMFKNTGANASETLEINLPNMTSMLNNAEGMFDGCRASNIDISGIFLHRVINANYMLRNTILLDSISFNTSRFLIASRSFTAVSICEGSNVSNIDFSWMNTQFMNQSALNNSFLNSQTTNLTVYNDTDKQKFINSLNFPDNIEITTIV